MKQNWKRQFMTVYAGQAFSIIGSAAVQFAIIWYLTVQTESAITLTTAAIVGFLPNALLGPFAGIWVDRYNRRTVMMLADGLVALSSVALGIAFLTAGTPPVWFIYGVLFLRGIGSTFHSPAMQAAIPMLVPADMLTKAGGWGNLITSGSNMLGPVLGAALMGIMPIAAVMLVDILGAGVAIGCLLFIRIPDIPQSGEKLNLLSDMKQGFRAIRENRLLTAGLPFIVLVGVLFMPLSSLFPLLVLTHFQGEAIHNSIAELVFAGGMLIASIALGVWGGMKRKFFMISLSVLVIGLAIAIGGLLPSSGFAVFVVCAFVMGNTATFFNVPFMAYIQETTAPEVMGKVFSLLLTMMTLANPIGLAIAGPLSDWTGVSNWFVYSGLALVLIGLLCWIRTWKHESMLLQKQNHTV